MRRSYSARLASSVVWGADAAVVRGVGDNLAHPIENDTQGNQNDYDSPNEGVAAPCTSAVSTSGGRARLGYPNAVVSAPHKSMLVFAPSFAQTNVPRGLTFQRQMGAAVILSTVVSGPAAPHGCTNRAATTIQINAGTAVVVHRPSAYSTLATRSKGQRSKDEHSPTVGRLVVAVETVHARCCALDN